MNWYQKFLVVLCACWANQSMALTCSGPSEDYILLCEQDKCSQGFRVYDVPGRVYCTYYWLKVGQGEPDVLLALNKLFGYSEFSGQPGIYKFALDKEPIWFRERDPKRHALLFDIMARSQDESHFSEQFITRLYEKPSVEQLNRIKDEARDRADRIKQSNWQKLAVVYITALPFVVILIWSIFAFIKPFKTKSDMSLFRSVVRPMKWQVGIVVGMLGWGVTNPYTLFVGIAGFWLFFASAALFVVEIAILLINRCVELSKE